MPPPPPPPPTWIDRHNHHRTVPLQILCLGLSRTGTFSLKLALHTLGYNDVYHMASVVQNPPDSLLWEDFITAKYYPPPTSTPNNNNNSAHLSREKWDTLLGHCAAVADSPCIAFIPELMAAYPDAKIILTTRSEESWYASITQAVMPLYADLHSWTNAWFRLLDPAARMRERMYMRLFPKLWGERAELPGRLEGMLGRHNGEVRRLVEEERGGGGGREMLVYEVREGWGPLCEFLGKEVPEGVEFPRVNDIEAFKVRVKALRAMAVRRALVKTLWLGAGVVGVGAVGVVLWQRTTGS